MRAGAKALDLPVDTGEVRTADLRALATDLGRSRERIETAFVDVGGWLTQSATMLNRITRVFETLPQDLASPELTEATARLAAVGQRAEEISISFAAEQSDVERLVAVVTAANHPISDLRRAVKMMGIVAVNARVVAAGVVGETDDFDVFTTDIRTLSDGAAHTILEFSEVYAKLTEEVHKAASQRAQFEAAHRNTLSGLALRLAANLAEVTDRRKASSDGSAETGRVSRQIAQRIASAVMAMQVGDATRQRIEHIEAALSTLADLVDGVMVGDVALAVADHASAQSDTARLEAAQLDDTTRVFVDEIADAERALAELSHDAETIMSSSRSVYSDGGNAGQSPLAKLNALVRRAVTVLRNCEAERQKLEQVASEVQATVKVLLGQVAAVQDIEANMRLVSLNAAVKCAQLGPRGRALNVIAMQLRTLTGETVVAAEAAMKSLGQAAALAQSFNASSSGEAAGQVAWLEQEAETAVELLETVDKRLAEALGLLNLDGPAAIGLLGQAAAGFSGYADIFENLDDARISIEAMADNGHPGIAPASHPLMRMLRKNYTMEAERRIHSNLVGADSEVPPAPAPEAEVDSLLF